MDTPVLRDPQTWVVRIDNPLPLLHGALTCCLPTTYAFTHMPPAIDQRWTQRLILTSEGQPKVIGANHFRERWYFHDCLKAMRIREYTIP